MVVLFYMLKIEGVTVFLSILLETITFFCFLVGEIENETSRLKNVMLMIFFSSVVVTKKLKESSIKQVKGKIFFSFLKDEKR